MLLPMAKFFVFLLLIWSAVVVVGIGPDPPPPTSLSSATSTTSTYPNSLVSTTGSLSENVSEPVSNC